MNQTYDSGVVSNILYNLTSGIFNIICIQNFFWFKNSSYSLLPLQTTNNKLS